TWSVSGTEQVSDITAWCSHRAMIRLQVGLCDRLLGRNRSRLLLRIIQLRGSTLRKLIWSCAFSNLNLRSICHYFLAPKFWLPLPLPMNPVFLAITRGRGAPGVCIGLEPGVPTAWFGWEPLALTPPYVLP